MPVPPVPVLPFRITVPPVPVLPLSPYYRFRITPLVPPKVYNPTPIIHDLRRTRNGENSPMDWTRYGDSTRTGDNKYVLACFRADANLGWVVELRSFLNISELKYRDYLPRRQYVASNARLQANLNKGLAEAELTVVDVERYKTFAYLDLIDRGAEPGRDFNLSTLHEMAADDMLRDSPFSIQSEEMYYGLSRSDPSNAYPSELSDTLQELPDFDPQAIRHRAGGKLRDVQVLAARAYSMLSPSELQELRLIINWPIYRGNFAQNLDRIKKLAHVFDVEHAKSVPLLNELVGQIAEVSGVPRQLATHLASSKPIREASSTSSDHIQAADFAAGWAGDLLVATNNDLRSLARQVRWVTFNGVSVPA